MRDALVAGAIFPVLKLGALVYSTRDSSIAGSAFERSEEMRA